MFFYVKTPIRIGGKDYRTCICYNLTDLLKKTVEGLVAEGKAVITEDFVYFCNGKVVEKKAKAKKAVKKEAVKEIKIESEEIKETIDETKGF